MTIEFRWAENQPLRLPELAADLVLRQVAVIVTSAFTTPVAKAATSTIPIVFVSAPDPVESGLVTSLNRPVRRAREDGVSVPRAPSFAAMMMLVPVKTAAGWPTKLTTMMALQAVLENHTNQGGFDGNQPHEARRLLSGCGCSKSH